MHSAKVFVLAVALLGCLCDVRASRWWQKTVCEVDGCHLEWHAFREAELKAAIAANPSLPSKLAHCIGMFETDLAGNRSEGGIITDCIFDSIYVASGRRDLWNRVEECVSAQGLLPKNTELHNIELFC